MFRVLHDLQRSSPTRTTHLEPKREFAPYFKRSAEMGGSKRAVNPLLWRQSQTSSSEVHEGRRRLRGVQAPFAGGAALNDHSS